MRVNNKWILVLILFICRDVSAQLIKGQPFLDNYTTDTYLASAQNWAVGQTGNGLMYFGNNDGLLEFDGHRWRLYPIPNKTTVRSVWADVDGRVYVGAQGDFGYFKPDKKGLFSFISLKKHLNGKIDIGEVWRVFKVGGSVVFQLNSGVAVFQNNELKFIPSNENLQFSYLIKNKIYCTVPGKGILIFEDGRFHPYGDSSLLAPLDIASIIPFDETTLLLATYTHGLFLYDGLSLKKWGEESDKEFIEKSPFCGIRISDNLFAFGTSHDGIYILNKEGKEVLHLNRSGGLHNNTVLAMGLDAEKNLWLALENGISYLMLNSPFSFIQPSGLNTAPAYAAVANSGRLYLGTNEALYVSENKADENSILFSSVAGAGGIVWNITSIDTDVLIGKHTGAYLMEGNKLTKIFEGPGAWNFKKLSNFPGKVLVGTYSGLYIIEKLHGKWQMLNKVEGFDESSRFIEEDEKGTLWVSHSYKGVYKISLSADLKKVAAVGFYNSSKGLPADIQNNVSAIDGKVVIATETGIYKYNPEQDIFIKDKFFSSIFGSTDHINRIVQTDSNSLWLSRDDQPIYYKKIKGQWKEQKISFRKFKHALVKNFELFYKLNDYQTVIGIQNGFLIYNRNFNTQPLSRFKPIIREALGRDSICFGTPHTSRALEFGFKSLRFIFSSPSYNTPAQVEYQYYLEGLDSKWSGWSTQTEKEYSHLPEGKYVLKIKARDVLGEEIVSDSYSFEVLPPWYRTWWAYTGYILLFGLSGIGFLKINNNRIRRADKKALEDKQKEIQLAEARILQEQLNTEKELIRMRNENLLREVEYKNKELASTTMYILHKNEALQQIKTKLLKFLNETEEFKKEHIETLIKTIDQDMDIDKNWNLFEIHFDQVHDKFLTRLRARFPHLSPTDLKLCAYLRINLSTKEIAPLLNISIRGVEIARYRLRKKLNLGTDINLLEFIINL